MPCQVRLQLCGVRIALLVDTTCATATVDSRYLPPQDPYASYTSSPKFQPSDPRDGLVNVTA